MSEINAEPREQEPFVIDEEPNPGFVTRQRKKKRKLAGLKEAEEAVNFVADLVEKTLKFTSFLHERLDSNLEATKDAQPQLFRGKLREYQIEGFLWLKAVYENGANAILGDEMGLGKTAQSIAVIAHLVEKGVKGPFLVCAPTSTLGNWIAELERFAPKVKTLYYHGTKEERRSSWKKMEKDAANEKVLSPVVVTSYAIALKDTVLFKKVEWKYIIIDEAHRLKNADCKLFKAFRVIASTKFIPHVLLTGTPLQNNLSELWSLLNYVLPEVFQDFHAFKSLIDFTEFQEYEGREDVLIEKKKDQIVAGIYQVLTPFFLRRTKAEVELREGKSIPPKREIIIYVPMTSIQKELYYRVHHLQQKGVKYVPEKLEKRKRMEIDYNDEYDSDSSFSSVDLDNGENISSMSASASIVNPPKLKIEKCYLIWEMRRICQHPYLVQNFLNPRNGTEADEDLVRWSGKFVILDALLTKMKQDGHKVLIFSQMLAVLNMLEEYCELRNFGYSRLDGSMDLSERAENIDSFKENNEMFVFLLTTKAGGLGLNLVAADTAIIFDSDYNPQNDLQAQDRCHRIGQTKPVLIIRLVSQDCIDNELVDVASKKRTLERLIIPNGRYNTNDTFTKQQKPLSKEEFLECIKKADGRREYKISNLEMSNDLLNEILDRSDMI